MKIGRPQLIIFLVLVPVFGAHADINDEYNKIRERALVEYNKVRDDAIQEYESIRRKANEEFARIMEQAWEPMELRPLEKLPVNPTPDPIIVDKDTIPEDTPVPIIISEVVPVPPPSPQPQPIDPIEDIIEGKENPHFSVVLYGTEFKLQKPDLTGYWFSARNGSEIAQAWKWLNNRYTNNLINDCLRLRDEKKLCDWAYLNLLQKVSEGIVGEKNNASTLLTGFLFNQSGYKMRFALDSSNRLHLFYNPTGIVYNIPCLVLDGSRFYRFDNGIPASNSFDVCKFSYPGEKPLSFEILRTMNLDYDPAPEIEVTAYSHPDVKVSVAVNKNLIDFYNSYPEATITNDFLTRWALCGNTPASNEIKNSIYPSLREAIKGKSQKETVNIILHLAQAFQYGYDDEIWGKDRAFFMDESWHYPKSDCEDHAINFGRMVRDIVDLDVALVYYPGHLAAAVAFTDPIVSGDYIMYNGKKYIVCDPTIFYSNVGMTMRSMNNSEAKLVPLR